MKRDEMIGRAAKYAFEDMCCDPRDGSLVNIPDWRVVGHAAVAEARRIDTCETCRHRRVPGDVTPYYECRLWEIPTMHINEVGCNRHEPDVADCVDTMVEAAERLLNECDVVPPLVHQRDAVHALSAAIARVREARGDEVLGARSLPHGTSGLAV